MGREPSNDLVVPVSTVSSRHGTFRVTGGRCSYEDHSKNGSWLVVAGGKVSVCHCQEVALPERGEIRPGSSDNPGVAFAVGPTAPAERRLVEVVEEARRLLAAGGTEAARDLLEGAAASFPNEPEYLYLLAFARFQAGDLAAAREPYQAYLVLRPQDAEAWLDLGVVFERGGDPARAAIHYQHAATLSPDNPRARRLLDDLRRFTPVDRTEEVIPTNVLLGADRRDEVETDHFRVSYSLAAHAAHLRLLLKELERAYRQLEARLGAPEGGAIRVRVVTPEGADAWAVATPGDGPPAGGEIDLVIPELVELPAAHLQILATHELTHYWVASLSGHATGVPWWLHEGLAQRLSQRLSRERQEMVSSHVLKNGLPAPHTLDPTLGDMESLPLSLRYDLAYLLAHALIGNLGWGGVRDLLASFKSEDDAEAALNDRGVELRALVDDILDHVEEPEWWE